MGKEHHIDAFQMTPDHLKTENVDTWIKEFLGTINIKIHIGQTV